MIENCESVHKDLKFNGNPMLKRIGEPFYLTKEHLIELKKCAEDITYFISHYMTIVTIDAGKRLISLYDYQRRILEGLVSHRYNILLSCRQSGKCVSYDMEIQIRKKGGEPMKVKIGQFFEWISLRNYLKQQSFHFD